MSKAIQFVGGRNLVHPTPGPCSTRLPLPSHVDSHQDVWTSQSFLINTHVTPIRLKTLQSLNLAPLIPEKCGGGGHKVGLLIRGPQRP